MELARRDMLLAVMLAAAPTGNAIAAAADKVKFAYVPELNAAALFAAVDTGFFQQQGIDLELVRVNSSIDAAAFLANGQIDAGSLGLSAGIFNAIHRGFDMRAVGTAAAWGKVHSVAIVTNKEEFDAGRLSKLTDLKGRRLAVAGGPGSGGAYIANAALRTVGMSIKDVALVNLANSDMPVAIRNKAIDAGQVGVPYSVLAIAEGWGAPLIQNWEPGLANTQFFFGGKFLGNRRAVAIRTFEALVLGARSIQGDKLYSDENVKIFAKYLNAPEDIIRETKPLVYSPDLTLSVQSIMDQEKFHREIGYSEYQEPIPIDMIIDSTIQSAAIGQLGEYR